MLKTVIFYQLGSVTLLLSLTIHSSKTEQYNSTFSNLNHRNKFALKHHLPPEDLPERANINKEQDKVVDKTINTEVVQFNVSLHEVIDRFVIKTHYYRRNTVVTNKRLSIPESILQHRMGERSSLENKQSYSSKNKENKNISLVEKAREDAYRKTKAAEYPHAVVFLISFTDEEEWSALCSGSLLTLEWVLTAAHCVSDAKIVNVYAGLVASVLTIEEIPEEAQSIVSDQLYTHPDYSSETLKNDIALIKLNYKFNLTEYVKPAKMSAVPWNHKGYRNCVLISFGSVRIGVDSPDDYVRKAHLLEVKKPCICDFRLQMWFGKPAVDKYICTKSKQDFGACNGDSGGGLICDGEIKAVASLILSFTNLFACTLVLPLKIFDSMKCGEFNTLSVFHDTCPHLQWINAYVQLMNDSDIDLGCKSDGPQLYHYHLLLYYNYACVFLAMYMR